MRFGFWVLWLDTGIWNLGSAIYNRSVRGSGSGFGFKFRFRVRVLRSAIDCFWFINGILTIIQGSFILVMAKGLLKRLPIFIKASGLIKCLIKGLPVVVSYYILLWVLARISKWAFRLCQDLKEMNSIWVNR